MADLFELDINKYSITELMEMLNLQTPFSLEDVVRSEDTLRERLLVDNGVKAKKKDDIILFLEQVKKQLLTIAKTEIINTHNVIERNHKAVKYLNPIVRETNSDDNLGRSTIKRLISVDTQFRDNYYNTKSSNFQYTLPTVVKNVVSMELCGLEIPDSYYQISRNLGNDYFWLGFDNDEDSKKWYFIAIPEGNYNRKTMVETMNQQISLALGTMGNDSKIFFLINKTSLKSAFVYRDIESGTKSIKIAFNRLRSTAVSTQPGIPNDVLPEIDINAPGGIMGKLGWILGFRMAEYTNKSGYIEMGDIGDMVEETEEIKSSVSPCYGYISEGVYNIWTNRYFYIVVDDFNKNANNFIVPTYSSSLGSSNILARITLNPPIAFEVGYTLTTENAWNNTTTKKRSYFGPVDITKIKFQILDSFGRIVDLNNMDCSFALNMVCLYDY
tara:strand:+ start:414 stop:1739 length:1326 start_codon:yes stop_codon:yes gene_type:complete